MSSGNRRVPDTDSGSQYFETYQLLHELLEDPENFRHHFERYTISIGCTIAFGKRVPSWEDPDTNILLEVCLADRLCAGGLLIHL